MSSLRNARVHGLPLEQNVPNSPILLVQVQNQMHEEIPRQIVKDVERPFQISFPTTSIFLGKA